MARLVIRRVPGHHWVQLFVSLTGQTEPGHGWMYSGLVRRDAWRIGRLGFGIMRLPRREVA